MTVLNMRKIPIDSVKEYWRRHQARTPDDIFSALHKLHDQQYAMMGYLMKAEGDSFNEAERETLYYLGTFIVYVMMQEFPEILPVPEDAMVKARELNVDLLGYLGSELPDNFRSSLDGIVAVHPQSDLLGFILKMLMYDPAMLKSVREEKVCYLFTHLKIVIDAMGSLVVEGVKS